MSRTPDDIPLHVERRGDAGPPVVLLHGFGAHSVTWRHWAPELARQHRLHLVDLAGHGRAPAPRAAAYGPEAHAERVHRYLLAREVRGATLVGHSLGGGIALLTALRLLDEGDGRLDSLVLVSAAALPQELPRFIGLARIPVLAELLLALLPTRWLIRAVLRSIVHDPGRVEPAQVEAYAAPLRARGGRRGVLRTARTIVPRGLDRIVERYAEVDVPALLVWGRQDPVVPPALGRRLAELLPRATLHELDGCGHLPPEELPGRALAPVRSFLDGRRAARGRP